MMLTVSSNFFLTEGGIYPQLPTQPKFFVHCHFELPCEEKSKFEPEEKKVQFITENGGLWLENSTNLHFQY